MFVHQLTGSSQPFCVVAHEWASFQLIPQSYEEVPYLLFYRGEKWGIEM